MNNQNSLASITLPERYTLCNKTDLSANCRLMTFLNVAGKILLVMFGILFLQLAAILRPEIQVRFVLRDSLVTALGVVAAYLLALTLHELVHGAFFWIFTRTRPDFGFKGLYAYVAAPDWFIPRNQFLIIGLAPLVLISFIGTALMPVVPAQLLLFLIVLLAANASGAVGDVYVTAWLLKQPQTALVQDRGDTFSIYGMECA